MTVKELMEELKKYDESTEVFVDGYEGGIEALETIRLLKIKLNVGERGIFGEHQLKQEGFDIEGLVIRRDDYGGTYDGGW